MVALFSGESVQAREVLALVLCERTVLVNNGVLKRMLHFSFGVPPSGRWPKVAQTSGSLTPEVSGISPMSA